MPVSVELSAQLPLCGVGLPWSSRVLLHSRLSANPEHWCGSTVNTGGGRGTSLKKGGVWALGREGPGSP